MAATPGSRVLELLRGLLPAVLLAALALAAGCAVLGSSHKEHVLAPEKIAQLKPGLSKVEVTQLLGAPQEILFSNKEHDPLREHAYIYEHKVDSATGIFFGVVNFGRLDAKSDRVVVFLDEAGKVTHVGASLHSEESSFGFPFGN